MLKRLNTTALPEAVPPFLWASLALVTAFAIAPETMAHCCTVILSQISVFFSSQAS